MNGRLSSGSGAGIYALNAQYGGNANLKAAERGMRESLRIAFRLSRKELKSMTINEYQKLAARTINKELAPLQVLWHSLFGLASEVGEIHGLYQKEYQGHETDPAHLMKELGDLMWFVAEYATANGWQLESIAQMNIDKLKARYPDGFDAEKSLHREAGDI